VTFPTKPVPPIKKIFLPLNISVGDNFIYLGARTLLSASPVPPAKLSVSIGDSESSAPVRVEATLMRTGVSALLPDVLTLNISIGDSFIGNGRLFSFQNPSTGVLKRFSGCIIHLMGPPDRLMAE
jgi:hypothetical protein